MTYKDSVISHYFHFIVVRPKEKRRNYRTLMNYTESHHSFLIVLGTPGHLNTKKKKNGLRYCSCPSLSEPTGPEYIVFFILCVQYRINTAILYILSFFETYCIIIIIIIYWYIRFRRTRRRRCILNENI